MPQPVDILIGIGSNIEPERYLPQAVEALKRRFGGLRVSTLYRTRPLRQRLQAPYVNGVAMARTRASVDEVLLLLAAVEREAGRRRVPGDAYASRTLDLDLLTYGDAVLPDKHLPGAALLERDFVLIPAAELRPDWRHPVEGLPLAELAAALFPSQPNILGEADYPSPPAGAAGSAFPFPK